MRAFLALCMLLLPLGAQAEEAPRVVTSIKPLHSLVSAVMEGVGEPQLLVPGGTSPHVFQMKPSQRALLEQAELVFYIGNGYEAFLVKALAQLPASVRVVSMETQKGMRLLPMRRGGNFEAHHHDGDEEEHGHEHDEHEHAGYKDLHLWLDPENARVIVGAVAQALAQRYPQHRERFAANAERLKEKLGALDAELKARLAPVKGKQFIVFHDAYQYLEKPYGVSAAGSITINPESPPGAKHMHELREKITALHIACVFREPQFDDRIAAALVRGTGAQEGTLDPLGAALPSGPALYFEMMRRLAGDLRKCLVPSA